MRRLLTDERGIATVLIVVLIVLGVLVVAIVGTAAVLLSNDVTITSEQSELWHVGRR
jgi:hypothetical protein